MKKYKFHYDSSHGWLEVDIEDIIRLNLQDKISEYSYKNGNKVFLEEDCDAPLFINEANIAPEDIGEVYDGDDSPIRKYERWK